LYGESFNDWHALGAYLTDWLNQVANVRIHATTGKQPQVHYDCEERPHMKPYLQPACLSMQKESVYTRQADKTGLISWQGNKYSVPMIFQSAKVGVNAENGKLYITDLENCEIVAYHQLSFGKGQIIKNRDHYRDKSLQIADYEKVIQAQLGEKLGQDLCQRLKLTSSVIYKDQLAGLKKLLAKQAQIPLELLAQLAKRTELKVSQIRDYLEIYANDPQCLDAHYDTNRPSSPQVKIMLAGYKELETHPTQEVSA